VSDVFRIKVWKWGSYTEALVDAEDDARLGLSLVRWHAVTGYACHNRLGYMHRHILGLEKGEQRFVHHVNENPVDNRKENLQVFESRSAANSAPHPKRDAACALSAEERYALWRAKWTAA
jgi:hypothetical protein